MTDSEIREVLTVIRNFYPQSFVNHTAESSNVLLSVWRHAFAKEDGRLVKEAVIRCIEESESSFMPPIGTVRKKMIEISGIVGDPTLSAAEAWETARRTWRSLESDNPRAIKPTWEKLDEITKRIYSPEDLVTLAFRTDPTQINNFEKPRFLKAYREMSEENLNRVLLTAPSITEVALAARSCPLLEDKHD